MKILLTGCAGFIGYHTAAKLLQSGVDIIGIDNINDYYSTKLKVDRLTKLKNHKNFQFIELDICNADAVKQLFKTHDFSQIIHLAAQPGVRYSITNPSAYINNNISGYLNILEAAKDHAPLQKIIYASSSSVYGSNTKLPYHEDDLIAQPNSLYATSKITNELMSTNYHHIYGINFIGLRFFTVYGPWGRPDMAPFIFTKNIFEDKTISLFNHGALKRDFTYIDDIVDGIIGATKYSQHGNEIFNLGNNQPVELMAFVQTLAQIIGKDPTTKLIEMQKGDVHATYADITKASKAFNFQPKTSIAAGLTNFVAWYKDYFKVL